MRELACGKASLIAMSWLLIIGCSATGPETFPVDAFLATIDVDGAPIVSVPGQILVGRDFEVAVVTYGDSGCHRMGPTHVTIDGSHALIRPFNRPNGHPFCSDHAQVLEHVANVRFDSPGSGVVTVRGWSSIERDTIEVAKEVEIKPVAN